MLSCLGFVAAWIGYVLRMPIITPSQAWMSSVVGVVARMVVNVAVVAVVVEMAFAVASGAVAYSRVVRSMVALPVLSVVPVMVVAGCWMGFQVSGGMSMPVSCHW